MITVRTMKHVASSRNLPSFRPCRMSNRANQSTTLLDQGRSVLGYARLLTSGARRKWRNGLWQVRR
ncbi:MAG: hypothetical protein AAGE59_06995 [Cyanobacteria bacterium P01_F01_bin.86]